jgi:uncharacterized membrane protein YfcA
VTSLEFTAVVLGISLIAGYLGSLAGVGGGIIVVPALTLLMGVDIQAAIAASIVSVIATSSGSASSHAGHRMANLRIGMVLEVATVIGALTGAYLAHWVSGRGLFVIFAAVLAYTAWSMVRSSGTPAAPKPDPIADRLRLHGSFFDRSLGCDVPYRVSRTRLGLATSYVAGVSSGLLGIGGGVLKVPVMSVAMGIPIKVCAATSNFMIGVTAAASAAVYLMRGDVRPFVAAPVAVGVLVGARLGAGLMGGMRNNSIRYIFITVLAVSAAEMLLKGIR